MFQGRDPAKLAVGRKQQTETDPNTVSCYSFVSNTYSVLLLQASLAGLPGFNVLLTPLDPYRHKELVISYSICSVLTGPPLLHPSH